MPYQPLQPKLFYGLKKEIEEKIYRPVAPLSTHAWITPEPVAYHNRYSGQRIELQPGEPWGKLWDCAWFRFEGQIPPSAIGKNVVLLIDINGELCLVDQEGTPTQGLTNVNSEFDLRLGLPGKRVVPITKAAVGGEVIDLWGDAGCNDLFGHYRSGTLKEASIAICHEEIRGLYYDVEVLLELAEQLPDDSSRRVQILQALYDASLLLTEINEANAAEARKIVAPELNKSGGDPTITVSAIGHAHIDLAWLWPIRETIRKGARTFATALRMLERYPDYVFGASQPQLYQWIKEHYPALYTQVQQRIEEGRWEVQGAMWVEPDSNISGGEALVRQILYGKRFFQQEFGVDVRSLWVPDIFGYTASLPQLLKKSGVDYMVTQKLSWNLYNEFPHHTFHWEGIDGSKVLTHLPPEDTYNSPGAPRSLAKIEREYVDKNVSDRCLMLFGIGDGGGGPGEEHLERLKREKNLLGLPPVVQEHSIAFLDKLNERADRYKTWRGELYLEKHQGTLTTQARSKKYNRQMEKALRELEFASVMAESLGSIPYPKEELEQIWKEVLLYQFHDILPGSSITRVYTESHERYEKLLPRTESLLQERYQQLAALTNTSGMETPYVLFNSLPWERKEWLEIDGVWKKVTVPPMGYTTIDLQSEESLSEIGIAAEENRIENEILRISLHADGTIASIFDKTVNREVLQKNRIGNQLTLYNDKGGDAWDFPVNYREMAPIPLIPNEFKTSISGPQATIEQSYQFGHSVLLQKIVLTAGSRRIDFQTQVHWHESDKMLRSSFPLDITNDQVNCEIQFGFLKRPTHRNTSWDMARDEICAHHWIDLSESSYGAALLNDSKYGFRATDSELDINLLRSPSYPDPEADRATHEFVYSLLPHRGNFLQAEIFKSGYELNVPLRALAAPKTKSTGASSAADYTLLETDQASIMVEAVKKAEDSNDLIIRLYETSGGKVSANLSIHLPYKRIEQVDLMEQSEEVIQADSGGRVPLLFTAFEIKTLKVIF
jgi:alpha-mannosidase